MADHERFPANVDERGEKAAIASLACALQLPQINLKLLTMAFTATYHAY